MIKCIDGPLEGQFIDSSLEAFKVADQTYRSFKYGYREVIYKKYKFVGEKKIFWFYSTLPLDEALTQLFGE